MHSYGRPGGRGVDEGGGTELSAAAVVPDLLTGIPGGDELAHGLGGLEGNGGGRGGSSGLEDGAGETGIEHRQHVLGAGQADQGAEVTEWECADQEGRVIGSRGVRRHQVALAIDGVAMSGVPEEQPGVRVAALDGEELLEGLL